MGRFFLALACCGCIVGAVWILHEGKDGWGWFLFIGLLLGYCVSDSYRKDNKDGE